MGCAAAYASCSVDVVTIRVRVENARSNAKVHMQLVYANDQVDDSAEATVQDKPMNFSVEFVTQSRRTLMMRSLREKCDRKPSMVVVTLVANDQ